MDILLSKFVKTYIDNFEYNQLSELDKLSRLSTHFLLFLDSSKGISNLPPNLILVEYKSTVPLVLSNPIFLAPICLLNL